MYISCHMLTILLDPYSVISQHLEAYHEFLMTIQLRNKRIMSGSPFDAQRAEPSQQVGTQPLDIHRAESSQRHVRALNNQFARCVF